MADKLWTLMWRPVPYVFMALILSQELIRDKPVTFGQLGIVFLIFGFSRGFVRSIRT